MLLFDGYFIALILCEVCRTQRLNFFVTFYYWREYILNLNFIYEASHDELNQVEISTI